MSDCQIGLMQDKERLVVPSQYKAIGQDCKFVTQAAESAGLNSQATFLVQLAVDEACTNIIEHAYGGTDQGQISVTCDIESVQGETFFLVRIEDQGKPFQPDLVPALHLTSDPEEFKIGGLGMHFMRKMMDRVEYHFHTGRNELVMYKRLEQEKT